MKLQKEKAKSLISIFLELSKPNILSLVLVATFLGYYLGNLGLGSIDILLYTLLGTSMTAAGSGALNHYLERDSLSRRETSNKGAPEVSINVLQQALGAAFKVKNKPTHSSL